MNGLFVGSFLRSPVSMIFFGKCIFLEMPQIKYRSCFVCVNYNIILYNEEYLFLKTLFLTRRKLYYEKPS